MVRLRLLVVCSAIALAVVANVGVIAQAGDPATLIKEKLASQIKVTKIAADRSDIVTDGDIVVLQKDGLMMCSTASSYPYPNTYANTKLTPNIKIHREVIWKSLQEGGSGVMDAFNNGCSKRKFLAGEKFRISKIEMKRDGIVVTTYSAPYNDVRYYGEVTFPFPHGVPIPSPDDFARTVAELISIQPPDAAVEKPAKNDPPSQSAALAPIAPPPPAADTPAPPMAPIAPPPLPPADAPPPAIAPGQTIDQVVAGLGQPLHRATPSARKQIYFYKDMKLTFVDGKVTDIQ